MRSINRKVSLAIGAAIVSVGLFGAVAFAAFAPDASTTTTDALFGQSNLVATNDIHYTEQSHARPHDVLLCIQQQKVQTDEKRLKFDTDAFYLKSAEEMRTPLGSGWAAGFPPLDPHPASATAATAAQMRGRLPKGWRRARGSQAMPLLIAESCCMR